jgi:UDP-N-acetylglucosamine--N-acetylmuramyl-(pentapeptide) pyrophosphoryl-undecaprenol N-acetylglucosamine transferase
LLLMGGSQGASDVNALRSPLASVLAASGDPWQIYHIAGRRDFVVDTDRDTDAASDASASQDELDVPVMSVPFEDDMASVYSLADAAVCRAGAATVAELAATGTPSVLVPYPHHADRHQVYNARPLVDAGGAFMVRADDATGRRTAPILLRTVIDRLGPMSVAARSVARPDAAEAVAQVVRSAAATS